MRNVLAAAVLFAVLGGSSATAGAQSASTAQTTAATQTFSNEQIIPLTVAQAWYKGGQSEANFYEMVTQLTVLSATNRGLKMPNDTATGQKCGAFFKAAAAKDPSQLLYVVVDSMVQHFGVKA